MKQIIAIVVSYLLAITAIVISLWRCEPFEIDALAVLANILALMVTILLGIIAYNYFIQKDEIKKYKSQVREEISKETFDIYINIMNSFGASSNTVSMFPMGVTVLGRINDDEDDKVTQICSLLSVCYNNMSAESKGNPIIKTSIVQLQNMLQKYKSNIAATQLLMVVQQ